MGCRGTLLAALFVGAMAVHQPLFAADAPRLADAAQKQDKQALQALIRDKANVNAPQPDGATASKDIAELVAEALVREPA